VSWRRLLVAAGIVAVFAAPAARASAPAGDPRVHYQITRAVDCDQLRQMYGEQHAAWKAEVRFGHRADDHLAYMVAIQRRLETLGECDGRGGRAPG
jgi:hypothetical protein